MQCTRLNRSMHAISLSARTHVCKPALLVISLRLSLANAVCRYFSYRFKFSISHFLRIELLLDLFDIKLLNFDASMTWRDVTWHDMKTAMWSERRKAPSDWCVSWRKIMTCWISPLLDYSVPYLWVFVLCLFFLYTRNACNLKPQYGGWVKIWCNIVVRFSHKTMPRALLMRDLQFNCFWLHVLLRNSFDRSMPSVM